MSRTVFALPFGIALTLLSLQNAYSAEGNLLQVAIDEHRLLIEFRLFEPSEADLNGDSSADIEKILARFSSQFTINHAAHCRPQSADVTMESDMSNNVWVGRYSATCENPPALTKIAVHLFARFPVIQQIPAQIIRRNGIVKQTLTAKNPVLLIPKAPLQ
ncbi:MAG: DUF2796 domain-containing protein [Pseudomonadota bacterium]